MSNENIRKILEKAGCTAKQVKEALALMEADGSIASMGAQPNPAVALVKEPEKTVEDGDMDADAQSDAEIDALINDLQDNIDDLEQLAQELSSAQDEDDDLNPDKVDDLLKEPAMAESEAPENPSEDELAAKSGEDTKADKEDDLKAEPKAEEPAAPEETKESEDSEKEPEAEPKKDDAEEKPDDECMESSENPEDTADLDALGGLPADLTEPEHEEEEMSTVANDNPEMEPKAEDDELGLPTDTEDDSKAKDQLPAEKSEDDEEASPTEENPAKNQFPAKSESKKSK